MRILRWFGLFSVLLFTPLVSLTVVADVVQAQAEPRVDHEPPAGQKKAKQVVEKKRCRRVQQRGSNIKKRVCLTPAQWDAGRENAARQMREVDIRGTASSGGGP